MRDYEAPESVKHWSGHDPSDAGYCEICEEHLDSGRCEGHCENDTCYHVSHCEECGQGFDYRLQDGICLDCQIRFRTRHQLGAPRSHIEQMIEHAKSMEANANS